MPKTNKEFDQIKYQNEYKKKTYDRMELLVPKGEKAVIKEIAAAAGISVNEFVYSAVKEKMKAIEHKPSKLYKNKEDAKFQNENGNTSMFSEEFLNNVWNEISK